MKKLLLLVLALSIVFCMTASASLPVGTKLYPTPEDYPNTDLKDHKVINMVLVGDGGDTYSDYPEVLADVNKELAKFNTELEVSVISWSDAGDKYPLALKSQDADLIFVATWRNLWEGAAEEAFFPMDMDFIEKYMPYTYQYQPKDSFAQTTYRGEIQAVTQNKAPSSPTLLGIRTDLAEEYGLNADFTDYEGLKAYLLGIAEHTPETKIFGYDAGKTDLLVVNQWLRIFNAHSVSRTGYFRFNYGDGSVPAPDSVYFCYGSDDYKWILNESKELREAGVWSRSALSNDKTASQAFQDGTGAVISWNYTIFQYMTYLEEQVKGVPKGSITKAINLYPERGNDVEGYNNNAIAILYGAEDRGNAERAAMVLDILKFNFDINTEICLGIEGRHWVDLGEGFYEKGPEAPKYQPSGMSWSWATQNDNWDVKYDRDDANEMYAACRANSAVNPTMAFVFDKKPVQAQSSAIDALITERQYTLGLGMFDDAEAEFNKLQDDLASAGLETYCNEFNSQYTAWYESLGL